MSRDLPNTMLKHSIGLTLRERERERRLRGEEEVAGWLVKPRKAKKKTRVG